MKIRAARFHIVQLRCLSYFFPMSDQQKISMGRVRQAYDLTANEVEQLIQSLWPDAVFPVELWNRTHETFWRAFADARQAVYKMESPTLPQVDLSLKRFQTYLLAHDIMDFFRRLSLNIHVNALKPGLTSILEESYEDMESIFSKEREFLFNSLDRLNTENIFEQYSPDSALFEKPVCSIPVSSYHFIAHIFVDTIMVDRDSAIRHLRHYPLRREVKGITRALVESVLRAAPSESAVADKAAVLPTCERSPQDGKLVFYVPGAIWEGRPDTAVRDAMKEKYPLAVIAYVLLYWCGPQKSEAGHKAPQGRKTHVGRLLAEKEYRDEKSYRNLMDMLLKEADAYSILKV